MITVIGAGSMSEAKGMSLEAFEIMQSADRVIFQTERQGCYIKGAKTLDAVFEQAEDFDDFAKKAAEFIVNCGNTAVFVAVGDGVNNSITRELCALKDDICILQGHGSDCVAAAVKGKSYGFNKVNYICAYDYLSFETRTDADVVIAGIDNELLFFDIKARLLDYYPLNCTVYVNSERTSLENAEYSGPCDLFLPRLMLLEKQRYSYDDLMEIVRELRQKCPWDREQTHKSILTNLVEECYELYEAIDKEETDMMLEEMGDVLLQICLHNVFECEHGDVYEDDVTTLISQKLIRRHPHVYGEAVAQTGEQVKKGWDEIKKQEYGLKSKADELRHISTYLPALMRAYKTEKKAKKLGINIDGNIEDAIKAIKSGTDVKENCSKLLMLAVKMIIEAGEHPYTCMNEGVDAFIDEVEREGL